MSSASIQKSFCGICSVLKCSFSEFVGETVASPSYSSAILGPPPQKNFKDIIVENFPNMEKEIVNHIQLEQSPIQEKSKEKHAKTHSNQTNKG